MRGHAKASPAGSIPATGKSRGLLGRALATRGARPGSDGSGAPASKRHAPLAFLGIFVLAITVVLGVASAIADEPPTVSIDPTPTEVTYNSARISGSVDPQAGPSSTLWHLEYTTLAAPEESDWVIATADQEIPAETEGSPTGPTPVSEVIAGLAPGSKYFVRLIATNQEGANRVPSSAPNPSFTTDAVAKPSAQIDDVTTFTATTAHFSGTVNSGGTGAGEATGTYHFECDPSCPGLEGERSIEPDPENPTGNDRVVSEDASALQPNIAYTVSLVVRNAQTDAEGQPVKDTAPSFTTLAVAPEPWAGTNTPESASTVLLRGAVNPRNSAITDCHFAYGPTTAYGQSAPCEPAHPITDELQAVVVQAGGGQFRLSFGGQTTPDIAFDAPASVLQERLRQLSTIGSPNVSVSGGPGNPGGFGKPEGIYRVTFEGSLGGKNLEQISAEEGTDPLTGGAEGETKVEVNTATDGGDLSRSLPVTAKLSGLAPGTVGHFKVVATSGAGTGESLDAPFATFSAPDPEAACPNQARREEQHSSFLPQCRAWELVSPPDKLGGDVLASSSQTRAGLAGQAAQFTSLQAFGDTKAAAIAVPYVASRDRAAGTQGWSTHGIFPQLEANSANEASNGLDAVYQAEFSPDLDKGVLATHTPLTDEPQTEQVQNLYLREGLLTPGADSSQLLSPCPVCAQAGEPLRWHPPSPYAPKVADATPDLGQVLFEANRNLTADAPAYRPYSESGFCNEDPGNPFPYAFGCAPRLYESDHGTLRLAGRIPPAGEIECDDAGATPCEGAPISIAGTSALQYANSQNTISDDGSKAFFTVPPNENEISGDLYLRLDHTATVQLNASERTDCADHDPCSGAPEPDPGGHRPAQYQIASADGGKVFFLSGEQLTDTTTQGDLYVYDTTLPASDPHNLRHVYAGGPQSFGVLGTSEDGSYLYFAVPGALLPGQPAPPTGAGVGIYAWHNGAISLIGSVNDNGPNNVGNGVTGRHGARVSPDGRTLLFTGDSGHGLTGYDHGSKCNGACDQLYLYRADSGSLSCVSCNPSAATASARAEINVQISTGGSQITSHFSRPLSDDGSHVFFETAERLSDADTDGASDVYSYDARTGALGLVSSGTDSDGAHFLDATPDGSNVFFSTRQTLLGWDADNNIDLYDARAGGGFPEPTPAPAPCRSDTCRTPSGPPAASSLNSQSFSGPANPKSCRKHKRQHCRRHKRQHRKQAGKKHHHKRAGHEQGGAK